ncbi:MAG: BrnT family toxin [Candidatus Binataceae bacterium]
MEFEWDPNKAANNFSKHGVRFAEAATVFEDEAALTMADDDPDEERFLALGLGSMGRILVVVYTTREDRIRIISARKATRQERSQYESRHR